MAALTESFLAEALGEDEGKGVEQGKKTSSCLKGLFHNSIECSRQITKIFKGRIDEAGYTWTKVSQSTKNFYFGEFKGEGSSTHTGGSISLHQHAKNLDNVLRLKQEREENAKSHVDETKLYIAATSGIKKIDMYGVGSKRAYYIIDSGNETTTLSKARDRWEKKSMDMKRKINKLNRTLEVVCSRFNITLPDCDSHRENGDGGYAHQGPNTSRTRAVLREEYDHDSRMIVSS
nr:hypothetical protein [Tanacetum cinerariifolium]